MTMTTCTPGTARQRYIVFAKLEKTIPARQGLPAGNLAAPKGA